MRCLTHSFRSDFVPLSLNRLSLESSQRSRDKGRLRAPCQAERTGDRCLSSQGRRQVSRVQNPGHRARSQWTEWMHLGSTQPTMSRAWRAMLTNIPTWHENTLRRCAGSLCSPYSSSSLFHPSFRAVLPVLIETYSGDLTHIETHVCMCPTLRSPMDSSVHGILQAKILEWIAMPSSRGTSQPRDLNDISYVSCIADGFFTC